MLLQQAAASRVGLLLRTNNPEGLRMQLYAVRRENQLPDLLELQIRMSPFPDGDLVICRESAGAQAPKALPVWQEIEDFDLEEGEQG